MEKRPLGTSGLQASVVAVGTGAMGDSAMQTGVDEREAIAAMHQAMDAGCNLIDTAPDYGGGRVEELVGRAIVGRRGEVLIATKCGSSVSYFNGATSFHSLSRSSVLQQCEQSLRRLRVETIDLYQCCRPDPRVPIRETMEALGALRSQGKIRAVGLCDFGCEEIAAAREYGVVDAVQASFSLLHRRAGEELLPFCAEHGIAAVVNSPLARGLLTGSLRAETRFTGIRARDPDFTGERYRRNLAIADRLRGAAEELGRTLTQLAINWVVHHSCVTSVIVGMHRPSQVIDVLGGIGWRLGESDRMRILDLARGRDDA